MLFKFSKLFYSVLSKCSINECKLLLYEKQVLNNLLLSLDTGPIGTLAQNPNIRSEFINYISNSSDLCKLTRNWILKKNESSDIIKQFDNFINKYFFSQLCSLRDLSLITDLTRPDLLFPQARQIGREIYIHHGPPNSGKTYKALEKLISAKTGIYCAPLRLMAFEVFNKLKDSGLKVNLLTGQQRIVEDNSTHLVCTIEMLPLDKKFDVGVIDEIQMISDESRGHFWSRAFFALQAKKLHLCGNTCALPLYIALANQCNEPAQIIEYNRLSYPIKISEEPITLEDLQPNDCLVSFSPISLFQYKSKLEFLGKESCILYGNMPLETRAKQVEKFRRGGYILLATDVIGMGLNLEINRVIMASLEKNIDGFPTLLTPLQLSQIINRAGRFGITDKPPVCGVLHESLINDFKKIMGTKVDSLSEIQLTPESNQLIAFMDSIKITESEDVTPSFYINTFKNLTSIYKPFNLSQINKMTKISIALQGIPLKNELFTEYLKSTLDTNHQINLAFIRLFASRHSKELPIYLNNIINFDLFECGIDKIYKLKLYEYIYNILDYYQYMAFKYPKVFSDAPACEGLKKQIADQVTLLVDSKIDINIFQKSEDEHIDKPEFFSEELKTSINYINSKFY